MKSSSIHPHPETIAAAQRAVRTHRHCTATLALLDVIRDDPGYRHVILRAAVACEDCELPETVIIKRSNLGGGHIFREWAALEFLGRHHTTSTITPALIGGDEACELLVLEDCGDVAP